MTIRFIVISPTLLTRGRCRRGLADEESFMGGRSAGTAAAGAALQLTGHGVEDAVHDAAGKAVARDRHRWKLVPHIARRIERLGVLEHADHVAIEELAACHVDQISRGPERHSAARIWHARDDA